MVGQADLRHTIIHMIPYWKDDILLKRWDCAESCDTKYVNKAYTVSELFH